MPENVDKDVKVLNRWLERFADKRGGGGGGGGRPEKRQAKGIDPRLLARTRELNPSAEIIRAMIAAPPDQQGLVTPGPGVVPTGELPESFRSQLPQGRQWVGLDPSNLSVEAMEWLMRHKMAENQRKDEQWLKENRPQPE